MGYPITKKTTALLRDNGPGILINVVYIAYDKVRVVAPRTGEVVGIAGIVRERGWGEDRITTWGVMIPERRGSYREVDGEKEMIQTLRKLIGICEEKAA